MPYKFKEKTKTKKKTVKFPKRGQRAKKNKSKRS